MCVGCCRYIIDHKIRQIPLIGTVLVRYCNAERGGFLYKIIAFIYKKDVQECENDWHEFFKEQEHE